MSTTAKHKARLSEALTLPEGWDVHELARGALEVSGYDGEQLQERTIEVIADDIVEISIQHAKMPSGRVDPEFDTEPIDVPIQAGVLRFDNLADAIPAIDELANPEVLDAFVELRSPYEQDEPLSVEEALRETTDIDFSRVTKTFDAI
jgi:hypothetical protein